MKDPLVAECDSLLAVIARHEAAWLRLFTLLADEYGVDETTKLFLKVFSEAK